MGKGVRNDGNSQEAAFAYLHGRIDTEIERFCLTTGCSLDEASQRVAFLLHPLGDRIQGQVSALLLDATQRVEQRQEVEGTEHPRLPGAHANATSETLPASKPKAKRKKRHLSPEGKASIVKSVKAMWARKRKAAKAAA